ncbi:MAG: hypothetical protein U9P73_01210 [Candidatus Cloacimonadota bacterium]|nr:hypothetical protein [Candidatus Cloacimonadota bacterium]
MLKLNRNSLKCFGRQKDVITIWFWMILLYGLIIGMVSCAAPRQGHSHLSCNIPPVILQEKIKTVLEEPPLNLNVISAFEGRIETEFEEYPGEVHGYLWFKKTWQERIKYIIIIKQSWGNSESSDVSIDAEIEHRLNDRFKWDPKKPTNENNKISEIFQRIDRIDK